MFTCKKCGKTDNFNLMFNPNYDGEKEVKITTNRKGNITINADGYSFTPDVNFMNNHAVCGYCGSIYCWKKSK